MRKSQTQDLFRRCWNNFKGTKELLEESRGSEKFCTVRNMKAKTRTRFEWAMAKTVSQMKRPIAIAASSKSAVVNSVSGLSGNSQTLLQTFRNRPDYLAI